MQSIFYFIHLIHLFVFFYPLQSHSYNLLPLPGEYIITNHHNHAETKTNRETEHKIGSVKIAVNQIGAGNANRPEHQNIYNRRITNQSHTVYDTDNTVEYRVEPL